MLQLQIPPELSEVHLPPGEQGIHHQLPRPTLHQALSRRLGQDLCIRLLLELLDLHIEVARVDSCLVRRRIVVGETDRDCHRIGVVRHHIAVVVNEMGKEGYVVGLLGMELENAREKVRRIGVVGDIGVAEEGRRSLVDGEEGVCLCSLVGLGKVKLRAMERRIEAVLHTVVVAVVDSAETGLRRSSLDSTC